MINAIIFIAAPMPAGTLPATILDLFVLPVIDTLVRQIQKRQRRWRAKERKQPNADRIPGRHPSLDYLTLMRKKSLTWVLLTGC
jgi:hypothetical protein